MINNATKEKKEKEILEIFNRINLIQDKESPEYKKYLQRIYSRIWDWSLICFKEDDVRKAGVEIFHCIKRTLKNYEDSYDSSYIGYLYSCLDFEIRRRKEKAEVKKFRVCTNDEYNRAVRLVREAERIGKNPSNEKVQIWLAKQSKLSLEEVRKLILKYYQSKVVEEQIKENEEGDDISVFETDAVHNNYLTPEQDVFKTEYALEDLAVIEQVFDKYQERQKGYLSSLYNTKTFASFGKNILNCTDCRAITRKNFSGCRFTKKVYFS